VTRTADPPQNPAPSAAKRYSRGPAPQEVARHVVDSQPRDWSQLGRRVMAEAWRRTTEELAARQAAEAKPAVPAPFDAVRGGADA
jgi:hypothetical protein